MSPAKMKTMVAMAIHRSSLFTFPAYAASIAWPTASKVAATATSHTTGRGLLRGRRTPSRRGACLRIAGTTGASLDRRPT